MISFLQHLPTLMCLYMNKKTVDSVYEFAILSKHTYVCELI